MDVWAIGKDLSGPSSEELKIRFSFIAISNKKIFLSPRESSRKNIIGYLGESGKESFGFPFHHKTS